MGRVARLVYRGCNAGLTLFRYLGMAAGVALALVLTSAMILSPCRGGGGLRFTKILIRELAAVASEAMDADRTCPTVDQLVARKLLHKAPRDAWGTPLVLQCPSVHGGDPVEVVSWGPDRKPDTADDISSWQ